MTSLLSLFIYHASAMRQQSVGIHGQLMCGAVPASNVRVKLFDKDTGDPFELLDLVVHLRNTYRS